MAKGSDTRLSRELILANQQLQNANETLRTQVSRLTILYQMGRDISENENWSDALDRFLMALVSYAKADGAALLLYGRNAQRLSPRSNFHVDEAGLTRACAVLGCRWRENPRGFEIHSVECYDDGPFRTCLESVKPWRMTVVPLRYRNFLWGFLLVDKRYRSKASFRLDYAFLTTIQTILAEEVANASYISDLRQLSRFNQKVLENIQSGVVTTDLEGHVLFWNRLASAMCPKLAPGARVTFDELCRAPAHAGSLFEAIMKSGDDTHVFDVVCRGEHDREFPGRLRISKMHDDNLNGTVLVGILEDLTEQKKMEAELRRTDRLRVLGQVSAGMAHEIGNPLAGIMSTAELLARQSVADDKRLTYARRILEETARLGDIVRNLLSFARPAKPEFRPCALSEVSERVVGLLSDQAEKKGVELRVRDDLCGAVCTADPSQLSQVLLNLVLNAIEACGPGDRVEILMAGESGAEGGNGTFARIEVVDSGPGIPGDIRGSLFEPFVTTKTQGTGLGLAISRQIVEEHHGDIRCDFLERGTRFTIRLPLGAGEAKTAAHPR
jgi:signal transduction histidine kinase